MEKNKNDKIIIIQGDTNPQKTVTKVQSGRKKLFKINPGIVTTRK